MKRRAKEGRELRVNGEERTNRRGRREKDEEIGTKGGGRGENEEAAKKGRGRAKEREKVAYVSRASTFGQGILRGRPGVGVT
jgi:hypothetical protein